MIGQTVTHYRITAKLGQGGMGEVYRATDTKLGRDVAIKVLPASISHHPESLVRFEREAKALAALNHPNIASIHGFDADHGTHFLVLELVEGDTLGERLKHGRLAVDEALRIAGQIAEAVESAHAKGIIHRDLKPGNIKITPDGRVKVLDFGLAKMEQSLRSGSGADLQPGHQEAATLPAETTMPGAVMGTPAYMSPEQARGHDVDKRTDVWAFGCCLFESLTGSKPFRGETITDMMAEVLRSQPNWSELPEETPREVTTLLRRCLEKDPRRRLSSLGDIALTLEETTQTGMRASVVRTELKLAPVPPVTGSLFARLAPALGVVALVVGLTAAGWALWLRPASGNRAGQIRSLAVLPFMHDTKDPKLEGLGRWIPAEIRSKLGSLTNLQVINSPAQTEELVRQKKSDVQIARELGVDGLVLGELHGEGETMSVYVSIVEGATGRTIGAQRAIPASTSKLPQIPNLVALALMDELNLRISASQRAGIEEPDTRNSDAFLAFQRGSELINRRHYDKAAAEFRTAYALDPNYIRAWVWLAHSEWVPAAVFGGNANDVRSTFKRLSADAERFALKRPDDPALTSLEMIIAMAYDRDWNKARNLFWEKRRAHKPDPDLLHGMMHYYVHIEGHADLALQLLDQSIVQEPENILYPLEKAYALAFLGRTDEALRVIRELPPEKITVEDFSWVLSQAGDLPAAKELASRLLTARPNPLTQCNLAAIQARSGAPGEARRLLQDLEGQVARGVHIPYCLMAVCYGTLGDFEAARGWLDKGLRQGQGDWSMLWLRSASVLELFGKLPWFWEIVDGMKFPPLQMDHLYFALEQQMRYHRDATGKLIANSNTNEPPKTLAVLPFDKLGAGADEDFNEGLTDAVITSLQNVKGLQVQSSMTMMRFKGAKDPKAVGEQLHVDQVLSGKVSRSGDLLRMNISLLRTADGVGLWATNYDRKLADTFAIHTEVAQQVAEALKVKLGIEDQRTFVRQQVGNAQAYALYLQGRAVWNRRNLSEFERAASLFHQALQKDTNYALAYAGLAGLHAGWPVYLIPPNTAEHRDRAVFFARKALDLDPTLGEAHAALGSVRAFFDWDWQGAEREFEAAILLDPKSGDAHRWYGTLLRCLGRPEEALRQSEAAVILEPNSVNHNSYAEALINAGQLDAGIAYAQKRIEEDPAGGFIWHHWTLACGYRQKGDGERLTVLVKPWLALPTTLPRMRAWILAVTGRKDEARTFLSQMDERDFLRVRVLEALGDMDSAFDVLERLIDEHLFVNSEEITWLRGSKRLQSSPRYEAALQKMNLKK